MFWLFITFSAMKLLYEAKLKNRYIYIKDIKDIFSKIWVEGKFTIYENLKVYFLNKVFTQMDSMHV